MTSKSPFQFSSILGGSGLVFACRLTGAALALLLQILLARWMGATELGVYVLAFSSCVLLANLSQLGFMNAAVRVIGQSVAHDQPGMIWGYRRRAFQIILGSSVCVALLACILVTFFGESLPGNSSVPYYIACASIPLLAIQNYECTLALAFRWLPIAVIPNEVARPAVALLVIATLWWIQDRINASEAMIVQAIAIAATAIALTAMVNFRIRLKVVSTSPQYDMRTWVHTALPLLLISVFGYYYPELMLILLGGFVESDQIAIFNACYRLALIVTFGLNSIDAVTNPVVARMYESGKLDELQRIVSQTAAIGFAASVAALLLFYIFGRFMLGLFGPEFTVGFQVLMIIVFSQVIRSSVGPVLPLLSMTGNHHRCPIVFAAASLASVVLMVLLAPVFGIVGAGITVLLVTLGWSFWLHAIVARHVGISPSIVNAVRVAWAQTRWAA